MPSQTKAVLTCAINSKYIIKKPKNVDISIVQTNNNTGKIRQKDAKFVITQHYFGILLFSYANNVL